MLGHTSAVVFPTADAMRPANPAEGQRSTRSQSAQYDALTPALAAACACVMPVANLHACNLHLRRFSFFMSFPFLHPSVFQD